MCVNCKLIQLCMLKNIYNKILKKKERKYKIMVQGH